MAVNTLARKGLGGHPILTLNKVGQPPKDCSSAGSAEQNLHSKNLNPTQAFEAWLWSERNKWSIRRGGMFGAARLKREDAPAALKRALAALEGGDA